MATIRRQVKNMVKNYSEAEVKVREATSNDPWGPSSTLMSEISDMTYNIVALGEIMRMIWKRLNDHGKNWRHVYKSLVLVDYLIKNGNEKVAQQCKEHIVAIQTLKDFQFTEEQKDQGANVREKAKQLVSLLRDDERLKEERAKAFRARERYAQNAMGISSDNKMVFAAGIPRSANKPNASYADPYGGSSSTGAADGAVGTDLEAVRPSDPNEEDLQIKLAIMLSQQEHEEEEKRKRADDAKLQLALEQSKTEGQPNSGLVDLGDSSFNDPWIGASGKKNALRQVDDPFAPAKNSDPWAATATNVLSKATNGAHDPWDKPPTASGIGANSTNPWFDSTATNGNGGGDPWASNGHSDSSAKIDDFEVFTSNRAAATPVNDPFGDFIPDDANKQAAASTNPWGPSDSSNKPSTAAFDPFGLPAPVPAAKPTLPVSNSSSMITRKTPESFLGENSSLVNLENLIPQSTRPKSTNPFGSAINPTPPKNTTPVMGMTTSLSIGQLSSNPNPFMAQQAAATAKPSINQMQQQYNMFPFNSNSGSGGLPTQPLAQPLIMHPPSVGGMVSMPDAFNGISSNMHQPLYPSLIPPTNSSFAYAQPTQQQPQAANTNASTNPFLMM